MEDIYQDIWNADQTGNGVPALRPGEVFDDAVGYVIVDERTSTVGSGHRVLKEVKIPAAKKRTYVLCEKLFDNYALERAAGETVRTEETQEELDLIDAIVPTPPIQSAREHLQKSLDLQISDEILAAMIRETWFDMGTAGSQLDASGFEHVFVGEQASRADKIGGYHFWYKYHLDEGGQSAAGTAGQDLIQIIKLFFGQDVSPAALDDPGEANDSIEWRAQLVAHIGQEDALGLVGFLSRCLGLLGLLKQMGVPNSDSPLPRQTFQEVQVGLGEGIVGLSAPDSHHATDPVARKERRGH